MNNYRRKRIKRRLEDLGYSLADIAREYGCSKSLVSQVLSHPRQSKKLWQLICAKLGYDPMRENKAA